MGAARILITGVGGFVGAHMARRVAERGDFALGVGIGAPPAETCQVLAGSWQADVREAEALEAVVGAARPTAVVHLAAQSSGAVALERPVETYGINALGTFTLLEAVRHAAPRARVLVVGTGEVYGPQTAGCRVHESAPLRPVSPYGLSKAVADAIAEAYARHWGLDVVRTRSFGHTGPGQQDRFLVPSLARQIAEIEAGLREPVLKVGNLDVVRDLTDVRDVVEAYLALLREGRPGCAYNVCRGEGTRLADIAGSLSGRARVRMRIEVDAARVRTADIAHLVGDPGAIAADTGWRPEIELDRMLDDILMEWRHRVEPGAGTELLSDA
jgi:GDP-4-dehydro-6-deoxy-D-mannose reductase